MCISCLSGCASTLLLTAFNQGDTSKEEKPEVNRRLLHTIQSLRALQPPKTQRITLGYMPNSADLMPKEHQKFSTIIGKTYSKLTISIAPAKAQNIWEQLSLTNQRVSALRQTALLINKQLNIVFEPALEDDTLHIVVES